MPDEIEPITFTASVNKVQTLTDFGLRFTFDTSEENILAAASLIECKRKGLPLLIVAQPLTPTNTGKSTRSKSTRG